MPINKSFLLSITLTFFLAGCSAGQNTSNDTGKKPAGNEAVSIDHIHGLTYSKDGNSIYVATHHGLFERNKNGSTWQKIGKEDIDLMGFHVMSDGSMITSGHPGDNSQLPNPVGLLKSTDNGQNWKTISLTGKIDFHVLVPNAKDPSILYGLNQMGEGDYGAGIYKSEDAGKTWTRQDSVGLPDDLMKVYSLISLPMNPDILLAGTEQGLMKSENGGKSWKLSNRGQIVTALETLSPEKNEILGYVVMDQERGVMTSQDGGMTWKKLGLDLGKDAISSFSVNPNNRSEILASSYENSVYVSKEGGRNWEMIIEKGTAK